MKFIHLSDFHLGKRLKEYSLIPDQQYILDQIFQLICEERPDGVLLAGDIYDRSIPPTDAVGLLDEFLVKLSQTGIPTFLISGNHDSPERLAFGRRILEGGNIHISPSYEGHVAPITLCDEMGEVDIFLLPFLKPVHARRFFPEGEIESYTDTLSAAIAEMNVNPDRRNILVTHQFVTGASRCDSEEVSVGGSDNVDAAVFAPFDYVALGHIHGPQNVGDDRIRYCGTPLKYSFSEVAHQNSITVVELTDTLTVTTRPLTPLREMRELRGTYGELAAKEHYQGTDTDAYLRITLTDEEDVPDAMGRLRAIYPNIMELGYDNKRTRSGRAMPDATQSKELSPMELVASLYNQQNGQELSATQITYLESAISTVWEGEV